MHQEYNRPAGGSDVPPIFDILPFDKDRGSNQQNQYNPSNDFSDPKKSKYQQQQNNNNNEQSRKQKGRNESPTQGIKRSNYFPQKADFTAENPDNENNELEDENVSGNANTENSYPGTGGSYRPYMTPEEQNEGNFQTNVQHQQGRNKKNMQQSSEGEQMQYGNPQGPGNFRSQPKQPQNMPPQNYYNQQQQQQFFQNQQQQQNPNAPFQKRKSNKGQNPNFNPGNPKNFPNNNPTNFNNPPPLNQQNPYNRKSSGGAPPELNPVGQMSPTNANGKFNKGQGQGQGQNRPQYNDKNAQRAYNMPNMMPPNMQGMPQVQVQDMGMENFSPQDNMKNPMKDSSKMVQSPILYNNNAPNPSQMMAHAFHNPGPGGYPDMRQGGGGYILPGPEGVGQQFGYNQPPQMNQMMNKQPPQFVSGGSFPYQNPSLVDNSNLQNTNVKTFFYDLSDSLQKQNMKLKADVRRNIWVDI